MHKSITKIKLCGNNHKLSFKWCQSYAAAGFQIESNCYTYYESSLWIKRTWKPDWRDLQWDLSKTKNGL